MANLEIPGWNRASYLKDWAELNRIVIKECRKAARDLEVAWGRGGPQGTKRVQTWDGYFSSLAHRIHDLSLDSELFPETESAALNEILALDRVPHWDHVQDIETIRTLLKPDQAWEDYPEQAMGGDDDDDYM